MIPLRLLSNFVSMENFNIADPWILYLTKSKGMKLIFENNNNNDKENGIEQTLKTTYQNYMFRTTGKL